MPIWNVPFPRNPFFTGREQLLQNLHDALTHKWTAMRTPAQIQGISGLGGIGKTQTAVEYCYRYQHKYQAVLWTRAESETTLQTGFTQLATLLSLSEAEAQNPHETVQAIKRWLEQTPDWLLVLDNADEPDILRPFLPPLAAMS